MVAIEKDGEVISYAVMVRRLFKPMEGAGARMMHAAIGIAGESGEIRTAFTRKNLEEEFGDTEFYVEAAWQELPKDLRGEVPGLERWVSPAFGDIVDELHSLSSEILDHAKKVWVYGGAKGNRDKQISDLLIKYEQTLVTAYEFLGFDRNVIKYDNMLKLLVGKNGVAARYQSGNYSDAEALARADKREPRKFMSDQPQQTRKPAPWDK
jgi:hypothetical protein